MPDDTTPIASDDKGAAEASESTTGGTRGKLRDLANASIQSVADRTIALAQNGRFDEIDPKMREVLLAGVNLTTTSEDLSESDKSNADPALARYAEIGKKALANQALAKIEGETRDKVARESRLSDARDLFSEFADTEIDVKDWQAVDPTNFRLFPMDEAGNNKWRAAVSRFRGAQYATQYGAPKGEKDNTSLDADRQAAAQRGRTPQPRSTGAQPVTGDLEAAKGLVTGKVTREQYVERLRSKGYG